MGKRREANSQRWNILHVMKMFSHHSHSLSLNGIFVAVVGVVIWCGAAEFLLLNVNDTIFKGILVEMPRFIIYMLYSTYRYYTIYI